MKRKCKKSMALILSMLMLISVFSVSATAYFPYINNGGGANEKISDKFQITSINVTDLYGDDVKSLEAGESALVSCRIKARTLDENVTAQLIAAAYNSVGEMIAVKRSDVITLGENAQDMGVYLTVKEDAAFLKAFIWDGSTKLLPLTKSADTASEDVNVLSVLFNGEEKDINTYKYDNVTVPAYQLETPSVQIITDNPAARVEVTSSASFPLTKQHGDAKGEAVITATVSLKGETVKTYIFNVEQEAPQITDAKFHEWKSGSDKTRIYHKPGETKPYKLEDDTQLSDSVTASFSLEKIKEADYSNSEYKRSEIETTLPAKGSEPDNGVYLNFTTSGADEYMIYDIPEEFVNGVLLQSVRRTASSKRCYSTYSLSQAGAISNESDLIASSQFAAYTFELNRSATVYVYNNPDEGYSETANVQTFINEGFKSTDIILPYYDFKATSGVSATRANHWYSKHIEVTGGTPVPVSIPVGAYSMNVVVKFDEYSATTSDNQKVSVVKDAIYTLDGEETATTTLRLFEPIPMDDDLVFAEQANQSYDNYIYKVQPWTDKDYILSGIDATVLGGEVIKLPNDPAKLTNVSFTLSDSADVYFVVNCKTGTTQEHWMNVKGEWFEDGWRLLPKEVSPIDKMLYLNINSKGKEYADWGNTGNEAVKKHFEVSDTPVKVTLDLAAFQTSEQFASTSTGNNAERAMLIIIKKTDR